VAGPHHIYLVPGFFGFANLGDVAYFGHVRDFLAAVCAEGKIDARLHVVRPPPTASLTRRATRLLETMANTAGADDGPIHLIGHSSGGLDARLLMTPGTQLPTAFSAEAYARRVRSVVCVSTPHRGTYLASFFNSLLGQKVLEVLSLSTMYVLRAGAFPFSILARLAGVFTRLDDIAFNSPLLDQLQAEILSDFTEERRSAISQFLAEVSLDQSLMLQLAPEGMDLFNVSAPDRPGVRYASVVTRARPPSLGTRLSAGLSPSAHATHSLYDALYRIAAQMPMERMNNIAESCRLSLVSGYGACPTSEDNDGIVPTLSQPWGEVLFCASADHLDAIGHFNGPDHLPPHFDWITTGTHFQRRDFETLWRKVANYLLA
jgi:triacylglycerol lipase